MISILFVDDEVNILEGIRDALRKKLGEWNLAFAKSGDEALEVLSSETFDIVVSDMRMPGMDGATLLSRIQDRHPHMARFILTGHADRNSILRAIPVTHQFIYKPISPADLLSLLERTCGLFERIQSNEVRLIVSGTKAVPSSPSTSRKIAELAKGGHSSMGEIAKLIERDPGLTSRVLQVANSAAFGRSREVLVVEDAISRIGLEFAQALTLAHEVFAVGKDFPHLARLVDRTYEKAFYGATLVGQYLAEKSNSAAAMTAALLRDIGLIVSASANPRVYKIASDSSSSSEEIVKTELGCLSTTHADIGGHLLSLWGLPMMIVEAVACHHAVEESTIDPIAMTAIHVADVKSELRGHSLEEIREAINWEFVELHQLEQDVEEWLELDVPAEVASA